MKWKRYATEGIASLLFRIFSPGGDRQSDRYRLGQDKTCISTDSTNIQAKRMGGQGAPHELWQQQDNRLPEKGRRGRTKSLGGSEYFICHFFCPEIAPVKAPMLTLVAAYAVLQWRFGNVQVWIYRLSGPMIWLSTEKICGI